MSSGRRTPSADFRALFEAAPEPYVVLAPADFAIVAVNDAYLRVTMTERSAIVGRGLFEVFPGNPDLPAATAGATNLRASLGRVLATRRADAMAVQRYDIRRPTSLGGGFEERWWSPINTPVLTDDGEVATIIHRVEDVTEIVRLRSAGEALDQLVRDQQAVIDRLRLANEEAARAAERALESENLTSALVAHLPGAAVFVVDGSLRYLVAEGEALTATGLSPSDLVGRTVGEALGTQVEADYAPFYRRALAGDAFSREHEEHDHVYLTRGAPLRDASGRVHAALAISTDITQRRRAEEALRQSEARYRTLFEAMGEGVALCEMVRDADGKAVDYRYVELNPAFESHMGLSRADAQGRLRGEVLPSSDASWMALYERVVTNGESVHTEHFSPALGRWFDVRAFPRGGDRFAVLFNNITARKDAEAALRESQVRLAAVFESLPVGVGVMDATGTLVLSNREMQRYLPTSVIPSRDPSRTWRWHAGDADGHPLGSQDFPGARALRGESVRPGLEMVFTRDDGGEVWTRVSSVPIRDGEGRVSGGAVVVTDIDDLKRTAEVLRESEEKYRTIFDSIDEGFGTVEVLYDDAGREVDLRYLETNPAFNRLTGVADLVGRTARAVSPTLEDGWLATLGRVARTGEPVRFEQHNADTGRWYTLHASRVGKAESRVVATVFDDITAQKRATAVLAAAADRDAFLVRLADALRPLADPVAIQAAAARLLAAHLDTSHAHYREVKGDADVGRRVCNDVDTDPAITPAEAARMSDAGFRASVVVPLLRDGQRVAVLALDNIAPRLWTADEVALVEETAERTWEAVERARAEAARRASETRYRLIVEEARDYAIFTTDEAGLITSWSPGAQAMLGWSVAEAVGQPFAMIFVPEDLATGEAERELAVAAEHGVAADVRWHVGKGGARIFLDGSTRALHDESARLIGFLKIAKDVTHRRALDDALRASEARYRALVENIGDYAIFLLDAHGVVTEWTPGAERVKGYTSDEVIGRHLAMFYPDEELASGEPARELAEAAATGRAEREGWRVRKGGERFWVNEIATAVHDRSGQLVGFTKISRDLTERRQMAEVAELVRAAAERDVLRRRLITAEEDERRRLSRELHDEAGQHLTALALGLQALSYVAPPGSEVDRRAAELRVLASTLGRELHALAVRLRPRALDDFGLEAALSAYVEDWSRQSGITVGIHARVAADRLPDVVESALYRIVQEALANVARHSGATHASVLVERRDGHVVAVVEDDGHGFAQDGVDRPREPGSGLGLLGMRERAALLGGSLEIESTPGGGGTTVFVRIPIVHPDDGLADG